MQSTTEIINNTLTNVTKNANFFQWYDYMIFVGLLFVSSIIGIYFGCFGNKQKTASEYLFGGKHMGTFPIAISLVASHISGITLLGVPADVYRFGAAYWLSLISFVITTIVTNTVYLPVFFKLKITSTYEYLEYRFDDRTRVISSFLFALAQFLFLPIVIYIPALAFASATGLNIHLITPIVCGICIFYTTIGGLKALVWTDTLQFMITLGTTACILYLGAKNAGGAAHIWSTALEGHRLDVFDFDPNPTKRDAFWTIIIGFTIHWISLSNSNQSCVQKYISLSSLRDAKLAAIYFGIGLGLVKTASVLLGLIMYSYYEKCDPFTTGKIKRNDQLLPHFVLTISDVLPGLSGFFIAGVFNAALSTLSGHLNCLSATIYQDFITRFFKKNISEETKGYTLKCIVAVSGIICTALVFIFEKLGGILPLAISFGGVTAGPLLGLFTLGMLFPKANKTGAFYGSVIGLLAILWIAMNAQYLKYKGLLTYQPKPLSTEGCTDFFNISSTFDSTKNATSLDVPFFLYRISHYYYAAFGCFVTMIAGLIISIFASNKDEPPVDRDLLSPVIHRWVPKNEKAELEYNSITNALNLVTYSTERDYIRP